MDRIIEHVSNGVPLAQVCREQGMPHVSTVYDWLNADPDLDRRFARAREIGHDTIASNARRVAKGEEGYSAGDVKRDRLIVDTDLKLLEKWDRRYRSTQVLAGDPDAPLVTPLDPASAIAGILEAARARRESDGSDLA